MEMLRIIFIPLILIYFLGFHISLGKTLNTYDRITLQREPSFKTLRFSLFAEFVGTFRIESGNSTPPMEITHSASMRIDPRTQNHCIYNQKLIRCATMVSQSYEIINKEHFKVSQSNIVYHYIIIQNFEQKDSKIIRYIEHLREP